MKMKDTAVKEILAAVFLCCGNYGDAEVFDLIFRYLRDIFIL